jgi:hypothetical protein
MVDIVYQTAKFQVYVNPEPTPEGVGYYDVVNVETGITEAKVSMLCDAIMLVDDMTDFLIKLDAKKAKVVKMQGPKH